MKKYDYFIAALKAGEYKRLAWLITAFSLINEAPDEWKNNPYPFRIVQKPNGFFFVKPGIKYEENEYETVDPSLYSDDDLEMIEDAPAGKPIFYVREKCFIKNFDIENFSVRQTQPTETSYGRILANQITLVHAFGKKVPFLNTKFMPSDIEKMIIGRLQDTPPEGAERDDKYIYVDEYLKFVDAMFGTIAGMTQLCVPAATERSLTFDPKVLIRKRELLEENKDRLTDPAVIAKIDAELVAMDREYMKGDEAENFLITDKSFSTVRRKQFGMLGAEAGFSDGTEVELIQNSLREGWDISKFPAMNNSLRQGSFNRGAQTELGGESVKWLLRASSNVSITIEDCGTTLGKKLEVDGENYKKLIGFSVITPQGPVLQDEDMAKAQVGKTVYMRSMMYCKAEKTDYCSVCAGERLRSNPTALSSAIAEYGSAFLYIFMSAMHGKNLTLARMDWKKAIF